MKFESGLFFTLELIECFPFTIRRGNFKTWQSTVILDSIWKPRDYREVIVFEKLICLNVFRPDKNAKLGLLSGLGSSPGWGHRVVFLARHFTLTVPLSTQLYKWVPANRWKNLTNFGWLTCDGLASRPWERRITSSRLMLHGSVLLNYLKIPRQS